MCEVRGQMENICKSYCKHKTSLKNTVKKKNEEKGRCVALMRGVTQI